MNMFKSTGGFTLVELIVVIAILAILAGVAVPAYSGYISKANEASDYTMLDSVKTAAIFETMDEDYNAVVSQIVVTEGKDGKADKVAVTYTDATGASKTIEVNVVEYVADIDFKSDNTSATWVAATGEWTLTK